MPSPFWKFLPVDVAHGLAPIGVKSAALLLDIYQQKIDFTFRPFEWKGQKFIHPLGVAGGVDKNGDLVDEFFKLGAAFMEVGTVTPREQDPNPGRIIDRDWDNQTLWNKMGFPSEGADEVAANLKKQKNLHARPVWVNLGKNRNTPNEKAAEDYRIGVEKFKEHADTYVINISSPNTQGLRDLQKKENLKAFLTPIRQATSKPMLVKLSPDLSQEELNSVLETSCECEFDGFVLTNTTLSRSGHTQKFSNEGGVSGAPLKEISDQCLKQCIQFLGNNKKDYLVVSAGGILTTDDVKRRLDFGADLLEVYSALVFKGPFFFKNTILELTAK